MTNLRPPSLSQVMAQNTAQSQAQYSASQSGGSSGSSSGGGSSTGSSAGYTAPNYGTGGPIRSQDFNAGWRHDNNGNWVNINAPSGSQYHGTQGLPDWQKNRNNTPTITPQQPQNDLFRQQQEMERQQREMLERQNEQNRQMQQQQMDAMRQQNDVWQKRQEEMQNNMRRMQAEQADFMTNRNTFERMTGYANKNEQERKVVDDYWNNNSNVNKQKSHSDYYNDIKNGVAVPNYEKSRPQYSQAEQQYNRIQKYKSMTSGQLANLFATGEMTSGDLALLQKENPSLAMDVAFTNSLNNSGKVDFEGDQLKMSNDIIKNWYTDLQNDERQSLLANALSNDANIQNAMNDTKNKADKL